MTLTQLLNSISSGQIFSVQFTKKDGTTRQMTCRTGVVKHVKGRGLSFDPISKGLVPVYDMKVQSYRFINYNTIDWIKINGTTTKFK